MAENQELRDVYSILSRSNTDLNHQLFAIPFYIEHDPQKKLKNELLWIHSICYTLLWKLKSRFFYIGDKFQNHLDYMTRTAKMPRVVISNDTVLLDIANPEEQDASLHYLEAYSQRPILKKMINGMFVCYWQDNNVYVLDVIPLYYSIQTVDTPDPKHEDRYRLMYCKERPRQVSTNEFEPIQFPFVNYLPIRCFERLKFQYGMSLSDSGGYHQYEITLLNIASDLPNLYRPEVFDAIVHGKEEALGMPIRRVYQKSKNDVLLTRVIFNNDVMHYHPLSFGKKTAEVYQGFFDVVVMKKHLMPFNLILITEAVTPFLNRVVGFRYYDLNAQSEEKLFIPVPFLLCSYV